MKGIDVTAPFRQLVDRRLWPLALLLLAAAAAVPMLLGKEAEIVAPGPTASAGAIAKAQVASTSNLTPVVTLGDAEAGEKRRKVLGARKDPFRPEPGAKAKKADTSSSTTPSGSTPVLPGGGSAAPTTGGVTAPAPAAPVAPKPSYELYSLKVRFGSSELEVLPESNLKRLTALPDAKEPAIIYLGLLEDHKTAVFLVDSRATVQGDGKCLPSAGNCQNLHLKVGETAFFDMAALDGQPGAQYQLDVLKVAKKKTSDAKAAKASMAKVARGGRSALRARVARAGRYRYDAKTGTLKRLSPKAYKAAMARASAK